ncbi:MAG TPA: hypothetical protein VMT16_10085 [Thermoanaerobaculia bacterium]|nr:hypothetical protein [Thermoanaerobaculia bacterium]
MTRRANLLRRNGGARIHAPGAWLPPLGFALAGAALAYGQPPEPAAETWYLLLAAGVPLLAAAVTAPPPAREAGWGAVVAATALYALPAGPQRGAALLAVAAGVLVVALGRRLRRVLRDAPPHPSPLPTADRGPSDASGSVGWAALLREAPWMAAAALGLQALLRASELLPAQLDLHQLARLTLPPLGAALALLALRRRFPPSAVLLLGSAPLLAGGSFTATGVVPLLALAAAAEIAAAWRRPRGAREWLRIAVAAALLLALTALRARATLLGLAAAAGLGLGTPAALGAAALALLLGLVAPHPENTLRTLWMVPWVLPVALLPRALPLPALLCGVALAGAGGLLLPAGDGLVAGLAVLLLGLRRGWPRQAQFSWSAILLTPALLLAAYPWLRPHPAALPSGLLGLPTEGAPILAALAVTAAAAWACRAWSAGWRWRVAAVALAAAVVVGWALLPPRSVSLLDGTTIRLDAEGPTWEAPWEGATVRAVTIGSLASHAGALAPGTPLAHLVLAAPDGAGARLPLRAGEETGEWAARRPDQAAVAAPPPWVSWVPPSGEFFAQRYRAEWRFAPPVGVVRIRLERHPRLPPEVQLTVTSLEVAP